MTGAGRTFRIFVSSTFADLKAERNALRERVFPRLRALCMARGCRFQAIDLRWGLVFGARSVAVSFTGAGVKDRLPIDHPTLRARRVWRRSPRRPSPQGMLWSCGSSGRALCLTRHASSANAPIVDGRWGPRRYRTASADANADAMAGLFVSPRSTGTVVVR